ncbi:hypothetical protein HOS79_gp085 [Lactobacillus phage Nyseid]|uniref:Uncharacterized protein n=1 Tax=Lactobacillus phage Nyseid TaxID=2079432 RepID=A0A2K9VCJ9_9CAUD|nr:hypothetical protein HOS79_gp085 [Lactobacillus phage Nyseid]AUV59884.1 hypothetical protein [Lactobacillus phage Nyseid]
MTINLKVGNVFHIEDPENHVRINNKDYMVVKDATGWTKRFFVVDLAGSRVLESFKSLNDINKFLKDAWDKYDVVVVN